jgi:hypothetical protein
LKNAETINKLYELALNGKSHTKYAFLVFSFVHAVFNSTYKRSLPILQNEKLVKVTSFFTIRNNMLLTQLNDVISRLIPAGITKYLSDFGLWFILRPLDDEVLDPRRILSMTDLEFGFVLWLVACFICFLCFICEISPRFQNKFRMLIGLINFVTVIRARMAIYHDKW